MSKPNSRPTRSRFSSPFVSGPLINAAPNQSNGQEPQKPKTFLDKWVEPALPAPRPSFAEAGLERHGVVANMAALGTRPTAKILKGALRLEGEGAGRAGRKSRGATPAVATPKEARDTPEPAANSRRGSVHRVDEAEKLGLQIAKKDEPAESTQSSSVLNVGPAEELDRAKEQGMSILQPSLVVDPFPQPPPTPHRPFTSTSIPSTPVRPEGYKMTETDRIVEIAVQEAVDEKRWPTAFAIRTLYDEGVTVNNKQLLELFEVIVHQAASDAQLKEFQALLKARKIEGRRYRAAEYYFLGDGIDPAAARPHPQSSPSGKRTITARVTRSSRQSSVHNVTQPSHEHEHVKKKQRGNNYKPSNLQLNNRAVNGAAKQNEPATPSQEVDMSRQTSNSGSSSSPLSSVDEKVIGNGFADSPAANTRYGISEDTQRRLQSITSAIAGTAPPPFVSPYANAQAFAATAETLAGFAARNHADPITHRKGTSPKTHPSSTSPAPELPHPSSLKSHVVAAAEDNQDPPSPPSSDPHMAPIAITSEEQEQEHAPNGVRDAGAPGQAELPSRGPRLENDLLTRMKRKARHTTEMSVEVEDSFVRGVPTPVSQEDGSPAEGGNPFAADRSRPPTKVRLFNRDAKQKYDYDSEDLSSPTFLDFRPDLAPGSMATSRAGTPASSPRPTRKGKTGSGLRVKTSPMKKKGALAGLPRASGERNSPAANGASNYQDENDDYCAACGGNGALVCCDTCPRSFHFKCVDPPMDENSLPDEEWYCDLCATARRPRHKPDVRGTFGHLLANLERKNPSAFHLPQDVRDYFTDVKTGTEGEYEEIVVQKSKKASGYEEVVDNFKLKDGKGNTILCHQCNGMAESPNRAIIPCTFCTLHWHLDCVPVPLANPPVKAWRCPAHIDDLLADLPGSLRPAHRFRRIKGAAPIEPALSRGIKNNGFIEIENEPDDPEEEQGFFDYTEYGKIYKLPENGIKLDFIAKIREATGGGYAHIVNRKLREENKPSETRSQSLAEQQAVLNLMALASHDPVAAPKKLYDALLVDAPKIIVDMVAQGDAINIQSGKCTDRDRHSLLALRALIDARLSKPLDVDVAPVARAKEANEVEMAD